MGATKEEAKAIRRQHNKFLKDQSKKWAEQNAAICVDYDKQVAAGRMEEDFLPELCEKHGCGPRRIRNAVARRAGAASIKVAKLNEASLMTAVGAMERDLRQANEEYDLQLEEILTLEEDGEEFYVIKQVEKEDKRFGDTITTEKLPLTLARNKIIELKLNLHERYWGMLGKLLPKQVIFDNSGAVSQETMQALAIRIREAEKANKIENGVYSDEPSAAQTE